MLTNDNLDAMIETLRHPWLGPEIEPRRMQLYEDRIELLVGELRAERTRTETLRAANARGIAEALAAEIPTCDFIYLNGVESWSDLPDMLEPLVARCIARAALAASVEEPA